VLLELNPRADANVSLSVGKQPAKGIPADFNDMQDLGTEVVLSMSVLRTHYDAIGGYIHMPTLKQLEEGKPHERDRLFRRLGEALGYVEKVLASSIFNVTMIGLNSQIDCARCGHRVRKAVDRDARELKARCPQCAAAYTLIANGDDGFDWVSDEARIPCANKDCDGEMFVFSDEAVVGLTVPCPKCQRSTRLILGVNLLSEA
jgi:hypothetical protein